MQIASQLLLARLLAYLVLVPFSLKAQAEVGVSKDKIRIGQSADFKGILADIGNQTRDGALAYFNHINAGGGVKGKKIELVSLNDFYDGHHTLMNTIDLIQNKNVFCLFGYVGTPNLLVALPAIQKLSSSGVFLFSTYSGSQAQRQKPHSDYTYNIRASYKDEAEKIVDHLVKIGKKRIALFIQFDAYGRAGAHGVSRRLQKYNLDIVAETTYLRGTLHTTSMKDQVEDIIKARADAVILVSVADASLAFIRDARATGLTIPIVNLSPDSESLLGHLIEAQKKIKVDLTANLINSQVVPPWTDNSYPLVREYQNIMRKNGKRMGFISLEGFLNAKVFVEVLKRIKGPITRKSFFNTAKKIRNLDVGLLKDKINFSKTNQGLNSVYFTTIKNHEHQIIKNWDEFR